MTTETTQLGVEEPKTGRDAKLDMIYENARKAKSDQILSAKPKEAEPITEFNESEIGKKEVIEKEVIEKAEVKLPEVRMVKVKVNGKEMEVPESQVIASYQKDQAASEKLRFASEQVKEAERIRKELDQREARLKAQESAPPKPDIKEAIMQYNQALIDGDVETAASLYEQINAGNKVPDYERLKEEAAEEATNRLRAEQRKDNAIAWDQEAEDAEKAFMQQFQTHLTADPTLEDAAKGIIKGLETKYPEWRPRQIMEETSRLISKWVSEPSDNSLSDRSSRKSGSTQVVGGNQRKSPPAKPRPLTPSEKIQQMREDRGQKRTG